MRKITETLSKEIVAAAEGEIVGIVTNAYVDRRLSRVRGYKVSSEDRDAGRLLPLRFLLGEEDAMVVKTLSILSETDLPDCPLGAKVFDTLGAFHGVLRDLIFDEKTGEIVSVLADEKEIAPDRILGFGKNAVILRAPCHDGVLFRKRAGRPSTRKPAPKKPSLEIAEEAEILSLPSLAEGEVAPTENETQRELFSGEYSFLLGRTVLKTIVAEGEALARESEIVTPSLIAKAREKGKLVELTVNSRKG